MKFYSITSPGKKVSLREAALRSVVNISDLYMPESIPRMPDAFLRNIRGKRLPEIAYEITNVVLKGDIPSETILKIVSEAFPFDTPVKKLNNNLYVLELFHGPTLAFKDVGARFMAGLLEYLNHDEDREITVLVATSGDTGSAVASAFYNRQGIKVIILFPSGKVSRIQEAQLTTMGGNIIALEIEGVFDDCQSLVKQAFADKVLNEKLRLTSANSINFARLFPQTFYYFRGYSQLSDSAGSVVFSVPGGNFGNLTAGLMAKRMGLPVSRFIASTNINRSVPDFLENGIFDPKPAQHTITSAMDVGNPGNFPRILELYNNDISSIRNDLKGYWFSDGQTMDAMKRLMDEYSYQADPHGAVAYLGLSEYMKREECNGIFLETAHPVKFCEIVEEVTGHRVPVPGSIEGLQGKESRSIRMSNKFGDFKSLLLTL